MNTNKKSKFENVSWTSELDNFIINSHFVDKKSLKVIQKEIGIHSSSISKRLKKLGYTPINYQNIRTYTYEDVLNLLKQGNNLSQTARLLNCSEASVIRILRQNNYVYRKPVHFNEHIFDTIDTEEKAYWLGFIYADGYISKSKTNNSFNFELTLKSSDKLHLEKFNKFTEHNGDIIKEKIVKINGKEYSACRWSVNNKYFWKSLNKLGCVPQKSLILKFPNLSIFKNQDLIRHFIRGYFDGDGCITRRIGKNNVSASLSILGTPEFINDLIKHINVYGKIKHHKHHSLQTVDLRYVKIDNVCEVLHYLYDNSTIYLDRKYKLYEFFKNGSRSIQEWMEFNESKSVEVCDDNTEVNVETKEFTSPYSVEIEPANAE